MSASDDIVKKIEEEAKAEMSYDQKKKIVDRHRIDSQLEYIEKRKTEMERLSKIDITALPDAYFDKMDEEHDRMIQSLTNRMPFINPDLTEFVPFSYPNLLLVGGKTGHGKSTTAANIVYSLLNDLNEQGKPRRVLVISNEEMSVNVLNRIICLEEGWNINNIKNFSLPQHETLRKRRREISANGRLRVIDSDFPGFKDVTTSIEGLKFVLENAYDRFQETGEAYDAILIDYFQKITISKENPRLRPFDVLVEVTNFLDGFYKRYPAPVVVFSQIKPESKDDAEFEHRVKLCKNIFVVSTHALEIVPDKRTLSTEFICHKHRFSSDENGTSVIVGWDKGFLVPYTDEFKMAVIKRLSEKEHQKLMGTIDFGKKG